MISYNIMGYVSLQRFHCLKDNNEKNCGFNDMCTWIFGVNNAENQSESHVFLRKCVTLKGITPKLLSEQGISEYYSRSCVFSE